MQGSVFHHDAGHLADETRPQHSFRLDEKALEGRHYGDASCRNYRESVLSMLPHRCGHACDKTVVLRMVSEPLGGTCQSGGEIK